MAPITRRNRRNDLTGGGGTATGIIGETKMKSMYLAFLAIIGIAVAADYGLDRAGFSIQDVTSGPAVRLD